MNKNFRKYVNEVNTKDPTSLFINKCIGDKIIDLYNLKYCANPCEYICTNNNEIKHLGINLDENNEYKSFIGYDMTNNKVEPISLFNERYLKAPKLIEGKSKVLFITDNFMDTLSYETIGYKAVLVGNDSLNMFLTLIESNKKNLSNIKFILDIKDKYLNEELYNAICEYKLSCYIYETTKDYKSANEYLISNKRDFVITTISFVKNTVLKEISKYEQIDNSSYDALVGNLETLDILSVEETLGADAGLSDDNLNGLEAEAMSLMQRAVYCWNNPVDASTLIKTGIEGFDKAVRYFERKGILIGAVPGMSKTSFCLAVAVNMALSKKHVKFFSLEMDKRFLETKILANLSYRPELADEPLNQEDIYIFLQEGIKVFDEEQYKTLLRCIQYYSDNIEKFLHIDDFRYTDTRKSSFKSIEAVRLETEKFIKEYRVRPVIFIDYIQSLTVENPAKAEASDKVRLDFITDVLIEMKKKLGITMFLVSSLNRDAYNNIITKASFKESGSIEYAAELLFGIQWRQMYKRVQSRPKSEQDMYLSLLNKMSKVVGFKELELFAAKGRTGGEGDAVYLNFHFLKNEFETVSEECIIEPNLNLSLEENIKIAEEIARNLRNEKLVDNKNTIMRRRR